MTKRHLQKYVRSYDDMEKNQHGKWCKSDDVDAALAALQTDHHDRLAEILAEHVVALARRDGALRNCLMLAMRLLHRKSIESPNWLHIVRFCKEAGIEPSILRDDLTRPRPRMVKHEEQSNGE